MSTAEVSRHADQLRKLIRDAMKAEGVTQKELGERIGCGQPTISDALTGRCGLSLALAERLLAGLGLELLPPVVRPVEGRPVIRQVIRDPDTGEVLAATCVDKPLEGRTLAAMVELAKAAQRMWDDMPADERAAIEGRQEASIRRIEERTKRLRRMGPE